MAEAPAPAPSADDELATKILRQVEYYFSDDSYPFDVRRGVRTIASIDAL